MVEKIQKKGRDTLSTIDALFKALVILAELVGAAVLAVYACTFNEFGYLLAGTVAVASVLAADALLKIYNSQKKIY